MSHDDTAAAAESDISETEALRKQVDTLHELVEQQAERIDELEAEMNRRAAVICDSGKVGDIVVQGDEGVARIGNVLKNAASQYDLEELREEIPDENPVDKNYVDNELGILHRERTKLAKRVTLIEDETDLSDVAVDAAEGRYTPLHQLERIGPEAITNSPGPTLRRAKTLLENKNRWGETHRNQKYGQHRVLSSKKHDLRTRLEDTRGESLQWAQVYRAMKLIAELGGSTVKFDERDSWGKMLIFPQGWSE